MHTTVINLLITPSTSAALTLTLNVPFAPKGVTNGQAYVISTEASTPITCTFTGYAVTIELPSPPASQLAISFKLWSLNDLLPYDPRMAFQRVGLSLTPILNIDSVQSANGLCHAVKQGTVSVVIASIVAKVTNSSILSKFRVRVPSITRTLTVADVAGSVQVGAVGVTGTVLVENGEIICAFTGNGRDTSYNLSVTVNVFDAT